MRASALCVIGAVFALVLKKQSPELVPLLALAAAVGALYVSLPLFRSMIAMIGQLL